VQRNECLSKIQEIIIDVTKDPSNTIQESTLLSDIKKMDSLRIVSIEMSIEDEFKREVTIDPKKTKTIGEIIDLILCL
jgi:acyl carrier protein